MHQQETVAKHEDEDGPCTRRDAITESRQPNFLRVLPVSKGLQNEGENFLSAVYGAPNYQKMI